jgi:hypothetical protein
VPGLPADEEPTGASLSFSGAWAAQRGGSRQLRAIWPRADGSPIGQSSRDRRSSRMARRSRYSSAVRPPSAKRRSSTSMPVSTCGALDRPRRHGGDPRTIQMIARMTSPQNRGNRRNQGPSQPWRQPSARGRTAPTAVNAAAVICTLLSSWVDARDIVGSRSRSVIGGARCLGLRRLERAGGRGYRDRGSRGCRAGATTRCEARFTLSG